MLRRSPRKKSSYKSKSTKLEKAAMSRHSSKLKRNFAMKELVLKIKRKRLKTRLGRMPSRVGYIDSVTTRRKKHGIPVFRTEAVEWPVEVGPLIVMPWLLQLKSARLTSGA